MNEKSTASKSNFSGLDYLSFWVFGTWQRKSLFRRLEMEQQKAKELGCDREIRIGDMKFILSPNGSGGRYGIYGRVYQLFAGGVYFGICKPSDDDKAPEMKVELKGEVLTQVGEAQALTFVKHVFHNLGLEYSHSKASRVDIRCDFTTFTVGEFFRLYEKGHGTSQARTFSEFRNADFEVETFYVGNHKSSDLVCRVYDKLAQIAGDERKIAVVNESILCGEETDTLTRVEFELKRDCLTKRFDCDSIEDVFDSLQAIVRNLTSEWLRVYRSKGTKSTKSKWKDDFRKLHPIWQEVTNNFAAFARGFKRRRIKGKRAGTQTQAARKNTTLGYLAKIAAGEGAKGFASPRELYDFIMRQFDDVGKNLAWFNQKVTDSRIKEQKRLHDDICKWFDDVAIESQEPLLARCETSLGLAGGG
ncbi:MAG: hypothetical protein HKN47_02780 [Pirellulaceae bacterium]|nr:hypothetical protein [Pirellulaceae bacterium]